MKAEVIMQTPNTMSGLIRLGILLTLAFFVGGFVMSHGIDLSAGPKAEGQLAIDQANAQKILTDTQSAQAKAAEDLKNQKIIDDQTRANTVRVLMVFKWIFYGAGSLFGLAVLLIVTINLFSYLGEVNFRISVTPIAVRSGEQVVVTSPLLPGILYLINDYAPGVVTKLTADQPPQLSEPKSASALAFARALSDFAHYPTIESRTTFSEVLGQILEGVPQLKSPTE